MSLLSGPSVPKLKVSDALRKRSGEKSETVGWSPRRKCPFNQSSAKIPITISCERGRATHRQMDGRTVEEHGEYTQEYATVRTPKSEESSDDAVWTKEAVRK